MFFLNKTFIFKLTFFRSKIILDEKKIQTFSVAFKSR